MHRASSVNCEIRLMNGYWIFMLLRENDQAQLDEDSVTIVVQ